MTEIGCDDADQKGTLLGQRAGKVIGPVAELGCRLDHPFAGFRGKPLRKRSVIQDQGDGGAGHPEMLREQAQVRRLAV